ncbi:ferredoxin [Candidatus Babeliales bacterium]|nr:ferredoxin [Candidatus Babeliales bacterium]
MKRVYIISGCIGCGSCEAICPQVFKVDSVSEIREKTDIEAYEDEIKEAAEICPVGVIKYEE